jgi:cytochrome c peroxidase
MIKFMPTTTPTTTTTSIRKRSSLVSSGSNTTNSRCVVLRGGFSSEKQQQKHKKSISNFRSQSSSDDEGKFVMHSTPHPIEEEEDVIEYCVLKSDEDLIHLSLTKRDVFRALVGIVGMVGMSTVVQGSAPPFARASNGESSLNKAAVSDSDFKQLRKDVKALMEKDANLGPTLVRLAWHSSGTYDKMTQTGGSSGGTIRFKEELAHGGNAGLDKMVAALEPIKERNPKISYADMYAYAGKVAIEEMGGPTMEFKYGRVDEMDPSKVTPNGRLPDADKGDHAGPKTTQGLRDVFYRMGFDDQEIVALSGAHALGRCHADASGYVGPWSSTPLLFNNSYYGLLKGLKWTENTKTKKFQYEDPSGQLMMLPSDIVLLEDENFKKYVDVYAKDQKKFFADFKNAFEKLELLGTSGLKTLKE